MSYVIPHPERRKDRKNEFRAQYQTFRARGDYFDAFVREAVSFAHEKFVSLDFH